MLPNALLEAMSAQLPVIVTHVGGIPSVITDGVEGYLVPPRESAELSERMITLATDPQLRYQMSQASLQRVTDEHSISKKVPQLATILRLN
jgi:glycosyltransferase involved in cell wall biosynthesis